jgi:hypothetical protein
MGPRGLDERLEHHRDEILVMPSLADISGKYTFRLLGVTDPPALDIGVAGVAWIVILTAICYLGIALSARTQQILLGAELVILVTFAAVALAQVYAEPPPVGSTPVSLTWFDPFHIGDSSKFTEAMVLAVFIYWGWDSCISVNEETEEPRSIPGHAAVVSTIIGPYALSRPRRSRSPGEQLTKNADDVLAPLERRPSARRSARSCLAVLTSARITRHRSFRPPAWSFRWHTRALSPRLAKSIHAISPASRR